MIPESVIEEVRARLDAVAVIGRHTTLRKSGSSFVGTCPFHSEKNPSFRVYAEKKRFRCYGCGAHGDVFEFLQKVERKEFPVVVRELAAEVGVEVPRRRGPRTSSRYASRRQAPSRRARHRRRTGARASGRPSARRPAGTWALAASRRRRPGSLDSGRRRRSGTTCTAPSQARTGSRTRTSSERGSSSTRGRASTTASAIASCSRSPTSTDA